MADFNPLDINSELILMVEFALKNKAAATGACFVTAFWGCTEAGTGPLANFFVTISHLDPKMCNNRT